MNRNARPVDIIFSHSFYDNLSLNKGENFSSQIIEDIKKASRTGALALIWRTSDETIILMFGSSGKFHGKPIEILRINNSEIITVFSKP
ncbi:hypothetical protein [Hahella sp. CCB-MM4]|uniref:hypothetical protein n=1 Tax=Hahella sp. (strain CCB-MM4) TaxID=1926491 RepID=UPI0011407AC0|nr:hypothetical protein [Hahella sp. CCB-MM4]